MKLTPCLLLLAQGSETEVQDFERMHDSNVKYLGQRDVIEPTQDWICFNLKKQYEKNWAECRQTVVEFMPSMGLSELDTSFKEKFEGDFDIDEKHKKLQEWFEYYCKGVNENTMSQMKMLTQLIESDFSKQIFSNPQFAQQLSSSMNLAQVSLPQTHGQGPDGQFPGTFLDWKEQEDLFSQVFYEISQTWFFCQHRLLKGFYTFEKVQFQEGMDAVWDEYIRQKENWRDLIRLEMDPRRLWLGKFLRYNLHQNEYHEMTLRPILNYEKIYAIVAEIERSKEGEKYLFCDTFSEENSNYLKRLNDIKQKFQTGYDQIVKIGKSNDWGQRVNAFSKEDLLNAKQFPIDVYYNFWKPQIQCYIGRFGKDDKIVELWKTVKYYTIEENSRYSMNGNFRKVLNRVRYWQYIPLEETRFTKESCKNAFSQALADRAKLISNTDADQKFTWTTPVEDDLTEEVVIENTERINEIVQFLDDWENLDERLYDSKGGRTILINQYSRITKIALEVSYWYTRMGEQGMSYHYLKPKDDPERKKDEPQEPRDQTKAYWFAKQITENARNLMRQTCWRPLSQQTFLVTPRY